MFNTYLFVRKIGIFSIFSKVQKDVCTLGILTAENYLILCSLSGGYNWGFATSTLGFLLNAFSRWIHNFLIFRQQFSIFLKQLYSLTNVLTIWILNRDCLWINKRLHFMSFSYLRIQLFQFWDTLSKYFFLNMPLRECESL